MRPTMCCVLRSHNIVLALQSEHKLRGTPVALKTALLGGQTLKYLASVESCLCEGWSSISSLVV